MNRLPDICSICGLPIIEHRFIDSVMIPLNIPAGSSYVDVRLSAQEAKRYRCPSGRGIIVIAFDSLSPERETEALRARLEAQQSRNLTLINLLCYIQEVMRCGYVLANYTDDPRPVNSLGTVWKNQKLDDQITKALMGART